MRSHSAQRCEPSVLLTQHSSYGCLPLACRAPPAPRSPDHALPVANAAGTEEDLYRTLLAPWEQAFVALECVVERVEVLQAPSKACFRGSLQVS